MKYFTGISLFAIILGTVLTSAAFATNPPSGDSNPSDLGNSTVDTSHINNPQTR